RVHTLKVPGVLASVRVDQVKHHDILDLLALAILRTPGGSLSLRGGLLRKQTKHLSRSTGAELYTHRELQGRTQLRLRPNWTAYGNMPPHRDTKLSMWSAKWRLG